MGDDLLTGDLDLFFTGDLDLLLTGDLLRIGDFDLRLGGERNRLTGDLDLRLLIGNGDLRLNLGGDRRGGVLRRSGGVRARTRGGGSFTGSTICTMIS